MKLFYRKTLSLLLTLSVLSAVTLSAAASEALGDDLTSRDTQLNKETQLSTNVFWSTTYSDLRTENFITYTPNADVTPIVTFGDVLTAKGTVSSMAKQLEGEGYRVVAGINGDFYNTTTGLPIGIVVAEGRLRSSDGGYYAVGFREDGSAVLGKPAIKISADFGYAVDDGLGGNTQMVRQIAGVNKARVSSGGIYLYTYDFNDKHTTGTTEPGVDVVCTIQDGQLAIGDTLTLVAERLLETDSATPIGQDQVVLSVNLQSDPYYVEALRNISEGSEITLSIAATSDVWNDVEYAVGALYALVENGAVVSGLQAGTNPRTAVGQKADGTLIFYTIDGRKSGHSIGASMSQVAQRLVELGCETAVCLDGGGSTALSITEPDDVEAKIINIPSEGKERAVSNQIFLVADSSPSGRLSHFYVSAEQSYILAGSKVNITASAVDTNFIPMDRRYDLWASDGTLENNVLTTPAYDGDITVTAEGGGRQGVTTVHVISTPDTIAVRSGETEVTNLTVTPGSSTTLTAAATYSHLPLKADPESFTWTVEGDIGTIDAGGVFTAGAPGTGTITVSAGGRSVSIEVTVCRVPLETVEDFEAEDTIFSGPYTDNAWFSRITGSEQVRLGRGTGKLEYTLTEEKGYDAEWRADNGTDINNRQYSSLNLWVCGDGSGNELYMIYSNGKEDSLKIPIAILDFTGWRQVSISTAGDDFEIQGLGVRAGEVTYIDDGLGTMLAIYPDTVHAGTVYIDHIVASFIGTVDDEVPVVTAELDNENWAVRATVTDAVDGVLPKESISVFYNGDGQDFEYDEITGQVTWWLPGPGEAGGPWRITITALDASGNIGRASVDVPAYGEGSDVHAFTDIDGYWGAAYADFLYTSGITTGYEDGTFRPDKNISRQQFAVMLYRCLRLDESEYADVELPFADNAQIGVYAEPAIKALYTEGIINGSVGKDGQLYFNPGNSLTRAQAATMIGRTQEKGYAAVELTFADAGQIPVYAQFYIQTMTAQGIINGYADGTFKPNNHITRGQMAKILYNLM